MAKYMMCRNCLFYTLPRLDEMRSDRRYRCVVLGKDVSRRASLVPVACRYFVDAVAAREYVRRQVFDDVSGDIVGYEPVWNSFNRSG